MIHILVIGAGRSATSLIDYLLKNAGTYNWHITVSDVDIQLARQKVAGYTGAEAVSFDIRDEVQRKNVLAKQDFVISMLPAAMHGDVARDCVELGIHMATASYVSADMRALDREAARKNIVLLNECGLDPGLDHASAMKVIDQITSQGGKLHSFKSYCGGLVAPESNDNPWGYKFSWNPRNVVLAGQGTAQYIEQGRVNFIPYSRLFRQTESVSVDGYGAFDAYANRDSLSYKEVYGLSDISTLLRGTLRQRGYCKAWHVFVKMGLTDDTSKITGAGKQTYTSLLASFLPPQKGSLKERMKQFMGHEWDAEIEQMMDYLEIFSDKPVPLMDGTPAQLLQALLEEKWKLKTGDKDMIVMQHQFEYTLPGSSDIKRLESSLGVIGKDERHTAMALTVGLPLAITVKNFLSKQFQFNGVQIPVHKEIYNPLLKELEMHQICFTER